MDPEKYFDEKFREGVTNELSDVSKKSIGILSFREKALLP